MESWSYVSENNNVSVSNQVISDSDSFARTKDISTNNISLVSGKQTCSGTNSFTDVINLPDISGEEPINDSIRNVSADKSVCSGSVTPVLKFPGVDHLSYKKPSFAVESSRDPSSLINLRLGAQVLSSSDQSFRPSKPRRRLSVLNNSPQIVCCQVHGCNKDLSSSKEYHKRHKVCEVHSKTAKVIVDGIEQRFCQQCSRFHLLAELDDGKRSCRKRLADHNKRRRKPNTITAHSAISAKLLHSFRSEGSEYGSTVLTSASFCSLSHPQRYQPGSENSDASANPLFGLEGSENLSDSVYVVGESSSRNRHGLHEPSDWPGPVFRGTGPTGETFGFSNAVGDCAPSLLSVQSQNSPNHPFVMTVLPSGSKTVRE